MNYGYSVSYGYNSNGVYGPRNITNNGKNQDQQDSTQSFKIVKPPSELDQLDIVWNIALQCQNP